jgi:toxin ParE1/3/4
LHSFRVEPPFNVHLIFYRVVDDALFAERLMHGARDLPRRLLEPPGLD